MHLSLSFSAGGTKEHVTATLQSQRDAAVAANPCAQQLADAVVAKVAHELEPVLDEATVSVSASVHVGVSYTPAS